MFIIDENGKVIEGQAITAEEASILEEVAEYFGTKSNMRYSYMQSEDVKKFVRHLIGEYTMTRRKTPVPEPEPVPHPLIPPAPVPVSTFVEPAAAEVAAWSYFDKTIDGRRKVPAEATSEADVAEHLEQNPIA